MPIIDAQIHIWRTGTANPPHLATPFLAEDAIRGMDEAGVDGAILHPPASWDLASNEQAVEAVLAYPKRFAILGYPPLDRPESRALIRTWKERPGMLGLRLYFNQPYNAEPRTSANNYRDSGAGCWASRTSRSSVPG